MGFRVASIQFLNEHCDIRNKLDALILKRKRSGEIDEARISIKKLTTTFRDLCREHGVRENEYPLNTTSRARRSIGRYVSWLTQQHIAKGTRARYGAAASKAFIRRYRRVQSSSSVGTI